jgi:hypothetical protein
LGSIFNVDFGDFIIGKKNSPKIAKAITIRNRIPFLDFALLSFELLRFLLAMLRK